MRRACLLAIVLMACKAKSSPVPSNEAASPAPVSSVVASASASAIPATTPGRAQLARWNSAHNARDAAALSALYAAHVDFYGQTLDGAECVKRKMAAFAKAPDYTQRVNGVNEYEPSGGKMLVEFIKTSIEKGKPRDFPSYLVLDADLRIVMEGDAVTDANLAALRTKAMGDIAWCVDSSGSATMGFFDTVGMVPKSTTIPPFTISAKTAIASARASKRLASYHTAVEITRIACPAPSCDTRTDPTDCSYKLRVEAVTKTPGALSSLIEWVSVDAKTNVLRPESDPSAAEQL